MAVAFPRDLVLEAYLGRWVAITSLAEGRSLRQADPVTVTWGLPNEQTRALAPPSTVEGVLNNTGGHWTPGNPMSDYWAYLQGRNVPTRLALRVSRDTFAGRTSAFSWLTSDTGDGWSDASSGSGTVAVGSGVGTHTQPNANAYVITFLGDSYGDGQSAITGSWNLNVAGGSIEPCNLVHRFQPSGTFAGEHYLLRVEVTTAEVLNVSIQHSTLGLISAVVQVNVLTPGANSQRAKFQIEGQTLRGKVYPAGPSNDPDQFEPLGWQVSAHHERLTGGFPGVRTGVDAGNTNVPVTVSYDDWDLRLVRHSGELTRLAPTWDVTHKIKKASFKIADVTQRLGRPQAPVLRSAPRRYLPLTGSDQMGYWPLDEARLEDAVKPVSGSGSPVNIRVLGDNAVGVNELAPWLGTGLTASPGINLVGAVTMPATSEWCVEWAFQATPGSPGIAGPFAVTTDGSLWQCRCNTSTGLVELLLNPSGGAQVLLNSATVETIKDGRLHHVRMVTQQSGGNVNGFIWIDGVFITSGTRVTFTNTPVTQLRLFCDVAPVTFGHMVIRIGIGTTLADTVNAIFGHRGETALARAIRLCAEEGVLLDYWDAPGLTRAMGSQGLLKFLDHLKECAEADGAFVYAPRYTPGLAFRGRRSMCARPADATLDYAAGHVARTLAPSADDRPTANRVTATRVDGGTVVVSQSSGPMNTNDPGTDPDAIGVSPTDLPVNVQADVQLGDAGGWVRALGTVPDVRYPRVTVNLRARELTLGADPTLPARSLLGLHPSGDRLVVQNLQAADFYRDLDQLVRGGTETYRNVNEHSIALNTAPYEKYRAGVFGDAGSRYDNGGVTTFDSSLTTTQTGARNVTVVTGSRWTLDAAMFPMDVDCEGERITLSGITGAGAAQVMTISARSVNGVVKAHSAGAVVKLWQPVYYS